MSSYFDWHHTAADTLDKIDPVELSLDVAAFAWITHSLADGAERLPRRRLRRSGERPLMTKYYKILRSIT